MEHQNQQKVVYVSRPKSVGLAFFLAFLFGPLGLLYASPMGSIILFILSIISFFVLPLIGAIIIWIASMIWAVVTAQQG